MVDQPAVDAALLAAAGRPDPRAVSRLLARGADPNTRTLTGVTPLMRAVRRGEKAPAMAQALLEHGADLSAADRLGRAALHYAAQAAGPETIRLLLAAGADADATGHKAWPPLWYAVQRRSLPVVSVLLEYGADPNVYGPWGYPILYAAIRNDTGGDAEIVRCLLEQGADPNIPWADDWEPLSGAVFEKRLDMVRLVLDYGGRLHPPYRGAPASIPLCRAVMFQDREIVEELLRRGANPNLPYRVGTTDLTPLLFAALREDEEIVKALLTAAADPLFECRPGETVLDVAVAECRSRMVPLLREALE